MDQNGYYLPVSCKAGNKYYLKIESNSEVAEFKLVVFVGYRPHPAEVFIRDEDKIRMAYRQDLYSNDNVDH